MKEIPVLPEEKLSSARYEMVERAVLALTEKTGLQTFLENEGKIIRITVGKRSYSFNIKAIPELPKNIGLLTNRPVKHPEKPVILVTRYASKLKAEKLKQAGLLFLDTVGNAYLDKNSLFIFIKGNTEPKPQHGEKTPYVFQTSGLKIILTLLLDLNVEKNTYQQIADKSGVSESSVVKVLSKLKEKDYLEGKYRLINRPNLLREWLRAYPTYLRGRTLIGRYRALDENWWKNAEIASFQAYWGEETAAACLTRYLHPTITTVYLKKPAGRFLLKNKLRKDPIANVVLREQFWNFNWAVKQQTVPALLVYADLLATGDSRNIETAKKIYQNELSHLIDSA